MVTQKTQDLTTPSPGPIRTLLEAATAAEQVARDSHRRRAFATTRLLIAGAHLNGYSYADLGGVLGVSADAVRNRDAGDGLVPAALFARLAGVPLETLTAWQENGLLPAAVSDDNGDPSYLAAVLIKAALEAVVSP